MLQITNSSMNGTHNLEVTSVSKLIRSKLCQITFFRFDTPQFENSQIKRVMAIANNI